MSPRRWPSHLIIWSLATCWAFFGLGGCAGQWLQRAFVAAVVP